MDQGIHDISADAYHADPAPEPSLSSSIAKILISQSAQHAFIAHPRLNPAYEPEHDKAFDMGSAAHALLLERDPTRIAWVIADDWRTKAAKEIRDEARAAGRFPLLAKYQAPLSEMTAQANLALARSELGDILESGKAEQTVIWQDGSAWCRARLDLLSADRKVILDYKTTEDASPEAAIRQIGRMQYDVQAEFYTRGMEAVNRLDGLPFAPTFVFLFQEITAPYACSLIALSNTYRQIGQHKVVGALAVWSRCMERREWPSYTTQIHYAEPRGWELALLEDIDGGAQA